jgi:hypothetical protein
MSSTFAYQEDEDERHDVERISSKDCDSEGMRSGDSIRIRLKMAQGGNRRVLRSMGTDLEHKPAILPYWKFI